MNKAETTKQSIIAHAAPLFNEKGIAGTSVDDILKASKVTKGCLYGHFESKEELSYAAVDYVFNKLSTRTTEVLGKLPSARSKIFAYLDLNKNALSTLITGGCPIVNLATESDDTNPVIKKKVKGMLERTISSFTNLLSDGIRNNEFSADLNPEEFAVKMFFAIEGANVMCRVLNSNKHMATTISSLKKELDGYSII